MILLSSPPRFPGFPFFPATVEPFWSALAARDFPRTFEGLRLGHPAPVLRTRLGGGEGAHRIRDIGDALRVDPATAGEVLVAVGEGGEGQPVQAQACRGGAPGLDSAVARTGPCSRPGVVVGGRVGAPLDCAPSAMGSSPHPRLDVAEFHGDGISAELSAAVHRVAEALPLDVTFHPVDLTLERRRRDAEGAYRDAEAAIRKYGVAVKYPTVTEDESPNKVLRERLDFSVIHRPVASIPGVPSRFDGLVDVHIVRIAVGGTYEDAGRRIGTEAAVSVRVIERRPSFQAAHFAFHLAGRLGCDVVSSSKYTIQRATDGLFEDVVREVAASYPEVGHRSELFDALLAKLIMHPEDYRVVVTPNEYGDFLSDAACGMVGSIGLGASASYAFDDEGRVTLAMFDPAGGTAPDIAGQGVANPSAALWAFAMLLEHTNYRALGRALDQGVRDAIRSGHTTRDLGGELGTEAFTEAVVAATLDRLAGKVPAEDTAS